MERLSDTAIEIINGLHTERLEYVSEYIPLIDAANRLSTYEDTGLEPEKVVFLKDIVEDAFSDKPDFTNHLRDLIQAEKDGRLVVLPAKTVFELAWDAGPNCDSICPVSIDDKGLCDFCDHGELFVYERPCRQEHIKQIGKTVFLTHEEAEAALEGGTHETDPV